MRFRFLAACGAFCPALFAAIDTSDIAPEILSLPEFRVYTTAELPKAEEWYYAQVGGLEILSNASAGNTRRFVRDFHVFQNVLSVVAPAAVAQAELPVTLILSGKEGQFRKIVPRSMARFAGNLDSALLRDQEIAAIMIDFQRRTRDEDNPEEIEFEPTEAFYREYVKLAMERLNPRPPIWFSEGIARIVSNARFTNSWIDFGNLGPLLQPGPDGLVEAHVSYTSTIAAGSFRSADMPGDPTRGIHPSGPGAIATNPSVGFPANEVRPRPTVTYVPIRLMPLEKFFAPPSLTPPRESEADERARRTWPKQAMLFVHFGLYAEESKYQPAFLDFLTRAMHEPVTEELFKECFGLSYETMERKLKSYILWARHQRHVFKLKKGQSLTHTPPFELRRATEAEVGRIKGEALRLGGDAIGAQREFVTAYLRGERDPALLASLGLLARQRGDHSRARVYLEHVASTSIPRPRAYLELARLRYEALAEEFGAGHSLTSAQATTVLQPLFAGLKRQPLLAETYLQIAAVWEHSAAAPTHADLAVLREGSELFSHNVALAERAAKLHAKHGFNEEAERLNERARTAPTRKPLSQSLIGIDSPVAVMPPGALPATFTGDFFETEQVDRKPAEKKPITAVGLAELLPDGMPAKVVVSFLVTPQGRAIQIQVRDHVAPEIGAAAVKAVEKAVFHPGLKGGKRVTTALTSIVTVNPKSG